MEQVLSAEDGVVIKGRGGVDQNEVDVRIHGLSLVDGFAEQEARGHDELCTVVDSALNGGEVALRGLVDRGVVGVGLAVLFGVLLQAFPGELVEAAVVDRVGIGDQGQLSLAAGNRSGSFAALSVGRGVLGVLGVVIAGAGAKRPGTGP